METKMKGLLKGLRYISQIFDSSKEPEMQIGYPTDVKHVAHIGWDNQATNNGPSWMTEFKGEPSPRGSGPGNRPPSGLSNDYQGRDLMQDKQPTRPPRRTSYGETASPKNDISPSSRQTLRRNSASSNAGGYGELLSQEPNDGSGKNRKSRSSATASGDSLQADAPAIPKQNRRRKTKGSSGGGSGKTKLKGTVPSQDLEVDGELVMNGIGAARPQMITSRGDDSF